jgi:glyoxylase-like metal-dependent hydrolase (beta-lactamase superfamily II)
MIKCIPLPLPFRLGSVNSYLVQAGTGYVLIDGGGQNSRTRLQNELHAAGCRPGDLRLIIVTHGDFDHIGNCAHLRRTFGSRIAMHRQDAPMAEQGNMFANRKSGNTVLRIASPVLFRFARSDRFTPDIYLQDGDSLSEYGFNALVLHIPGHSAGSIGILTADGALFCGDLLENTERPALGSILDERTEAAASLEKLRGYRITTVYPGHGMPFPMDMLM